MIPSDRQLRYKDKIAHGKKRLQNIELWSGNIDQEMARLAVYKAFQEVVEVQSDIIAMLLKDLNERPRDNYKNIEKMKELDIINSENDKILKESNGLRNRVIYPYNGFDESVAIESLGRLNRPLGKILEVFEKWIDQNLVK